MVKKKEEKSMMLKVFEIIALFFGVTAILLLLWGILNTLGVI